MVMSVLRVRRPNGISCGFGLTGSNACNPNERELEPDDEDVAVTIRLGDQELPRQWEKDGGAG